MFLQAAAFLDPNGVLVRVMESDLMPPNDGASGECVFCIALHFGSDATCPLPLPVFGDRPTGLRHSEGQRLRSDRESS